MRAEATLSKPSPLINIAAISVIVASLAAVGAIMGIIPSAHSQRQHIEGYAQPQQPVAADARHARDARGEPTDELKPQVAASCPSCGVVETVRAVEVPGQGTGVGAVAGGVTGAIVGSQFGNGNGRTAMGVLGAAGGAYAGHTIEKNIRKRTSYRVSVRMDDGSTRTFYQSSPPAVVVGDKVRVINGNLSSRG
jgi:outer membrane lipoprotein SlyB